MKREFIFSRSNAFNALRFQEIAAVADAVIRQMMERNGVDLAFDADLIDFTHLITGMCQPGDEIPVVGKEKQTLAVLVETPDGNNADLF